MASDIKKPDAVITLFPHEIKDKMWPLPVEDLFMVGIATLPKLHNLNIFTIGDLANYDYCKANGKTFDTKWSDWVKKAASFHLIRLLH